MGAAAHERAVAGVLQRLDLAVLVEPVEQVAARVRQEGLELDPGPGQVVLDQRAARRRCPRRSWR